MDDLKDISEKVKGKTEEVQGDIEQKLGKGVKGGMKKIKGKARQEKADVQSKAKRAGAKGDSDWDREEEW